MAPPIFLATDDAVTVVLYNRAPLSVEDQAWLALLADHDLSSTEARLVVEVRNRGTVELARGEGVSTAAVSIALDAAEVRP